jgi:nucleoside-diphosphate-sugar epimerase
MADACLFVADLPDEVYRANTRPMLSHINVGCGEDVSIAELAQLVAKMTGFAGNISFDTSQPDGAPRKLLDVSRLTNLGWRASIGLEDGVRATYDWYRDQIRP